MKIRLVLLRGLDPVWVRLSFRQNGFKIMKRLQTAKRWKLGWRRETPPKVVESFFPPNTDTRDFCFKMRSYQAARTKAAVTLPLTPGNFAHMWRKEVRRVSCRLFFPLLLLLPLFSSEKWSVQSILTPGLQPGCPEEEPFGTSLIVSLQ